MSKNCRCYQHCPDGKENSTCPAEGKCYKQYKTISTKEHELRMGCLPAHDRDKINQCHKLVDHSDNEHHLPTEMACCDPWEDGALCNDRLNITPKAWPSYSASTEQSMAVVIGVSVTITATIIAAVIIAFKCIERKKKGAFQNCTAVTTLDIQRPLLPETTTGSGQGTTAMNVRTIVKELQRASQPIGAGRFGRVFKAQHRHDAVAVKYFYPQFEESFHNETDIMHRPTINLRDDSIVGFIASDISQAGDGSILRMIVMDFVAFGSLENFLSSSSVTPQVAMKLATSLAHGVHFLHMEVNGQKGKESVAHRDLSNTSVMVKSGGICCISDFGMAYSRPINQVEEKDRQMPLMSRVPKILYAPPEYFLNAHAFHHPLMREKAAETDFDQLLAGDVYSMGLLLWEISNKVEVDGQFPPLYVPAFLTEVSGSHNLLPETMFDLVVNRKLLPQRPAWDTLYKILSECSANRWQDRLSSYKAKKLLDQVAKAQKF